MLKEILLCSFLLASAVFSQTNEYRWLDDSSAVSAPIQPPPGYTRCETTAGSFASWLQNLPLKQAAEAVYLYDGGLKTNQDAHARVIDIDTGPRDLQQCADAVIRLRSEYLYVKKRYDEIQFNFTSGEPVPFSRWIQGERPLVENNRTRWIREEDPDSSYTSFRKYLETIFIYAGSFSLEQQMESVEDPDSLQIGDCFIQGGFPGHTVIVVDFAAPSSDDPPIFMLAQSYMPAQDIHVLRNPLRPDLDPWYEIDQMNELITPEWTFEWKDLKRF